MSNINKDFKHLRPGTPDFDIRCVKDIAKSNAAQAADGQEGDFEANTLDTLIEYKLNTDTLRSIALRVYKTELLRLSGAPDNEKCARLLEGCLKRAPDLFHEAEAEAVRQAIHLLRHKRHR